MKLIQILGAATLLLQLTAGEVVLGKQRRTLFSNAGEQPAAIAAAAAGSTPNVAATAPSTLPSKAPSKGSTTPATTGQGTTAPAIQAGAGPPDPAAAAAAAAAQTAYQLAEFQNFEVSLALWASCILTIVALFLYRVARQGIRYVRTISSLNNQKQEFFYEPEENFAMVKKYLLHAPMFKHRRAQEFRPLRKIHAGSLPTRVQAIYLFIYLIYNVLLMVIFIDFTQPFPSLMNTIKNRAGNLALANFLPMIFIAGRESPFIPILHVPFDAWNTLHRWFARMVVLLVVVHIAALVAGVEGSRSVSARDFQLPPALLAIPVFIRWGLLALLAFLLILIQASSPLRHATYEIFKIVHKFLAAVVFVALYLHLKDQGKPQVASVGVAASFWATDYAFRFLILMRNHAGKGTSRAHVESLPGDVVKVTLEIPRPWRFTPGQHIYLYMPALSLWQSHPFSVAWASTQTEDVYPLEKLPIDSKFMDIKTVSKTKFCLIIKKRGGFTKSLVNKAKKAPDGKFSTFALVEGPIGGFDPLTSYGTVMLFAGGVGITHMVPYIQQLVTCHSRHTSPIRRIALIWVIPRPEALNWITPWMQEILQTPGRRECLRLMIYITKMGPNENIESPSQSIQIYSGRPDIGSLMDWECEVGNQVGAMGVSVRGGGALADDVRAAVRERQMVSNIDFVEESFTW